MKSLLDEARGYTGGVGALAQACDMSRANTYRILQGQAKEYPTGWMEKIGLQLNLKPARVYRLWQKAHKEWMAAEEDPRDKKIAALEQLLFLSIPALRNEWLCHVSKSGSRNKEENASWDRYQLAMKLTATQEILERKGDDS